MKKTVTWVDGQSTTELNEVQGNVPIDSTKFTEPVLISKDPQKK